MNDFDFSGVLDAMNAIGWSRTYGTELPSRTAINASAIQLPLSTPSMAFLRAQHLEDMYRHQYEAIEQYLAGAHTCLATGTASGKSLVFQVAALEVLAKSPKSTVIATYPTRALAKEQADRWHEAIALSGMHVSVGRIDGQVDTSVRLGILRQHRIVIMTPDIIHAWVLSNLREPAVKAFLARMQLIIVDEVHSYTGVFGSNAAFLYRRLQHVMHHVKAHPQYIAASATIADPRKIVHNLFGLPFTVIDSDRDTSQKYSVQIEMVTLPSTTDLLTTVIQFLTYLATHTSHRFISFVDSRKQVEQMASIITRPQDDEEVDYHFDKMERLDVLPFRAGYEADDLEKIHNRLRDQSLRGVISTSALELGMDIKNLDIAVLVGVPRSSTSLWQRIGRIGRHRPGLVIVINTGNIYDEAVFRHPQDILQRPHAESALYLENSRIQYIHAMCLARLGGEHDAVAIVQPDSNETDLSMTPVVWPTGFLDLCRKERLGEISTELQSMKTEGGEDPNHIFPLRDVESQFQIEFQQNHSKQRLGALSHSQVMREAYPGAVYYYITEPYRVNRILMNAKTIQVRKEKRYTTKPVALPTRIYPNFGDEQFVKQYRQGQMFIAECPIQVSEMITGFKERRGPNELHTQYPMDLAQTSVAFKLPYFSRRFFSTGIILTHSLFNQSGIELESIASLLFDSFLLLVAFERQDINFGSDKHLVQRGEIPENSRFIAIYDETYGSLHLSSRFLEEDILTRTWELAAQLSNDMSTFQSNDITRQVILNINDDNHNRREVMRTAREQQVASGIEAERVIMLGSKGIDITHNNDEFMIARVFLHPKLGVAYKGKYLDGNGTSDIILPIANIVEIPGESAMGDYDFDSGEVKPLMTLW